MNTEQPLVDTQDRQFRPAEDTAGEPMREHPLFDAGSRYSRMAAALGVVEKMRGYFLWLQAGGTTHAAPASGSARAESGHPFPMVAASVQCLVVRIDQPGVRLDAALDARLRSNGTDGKRLQLVLTLAKPEEIITRPTRCRAFLIEPEEWDALKNALGLADSSEVAGRLLDSVTLIQNLEAARILSGLPEAAGILDERGVAVLGSQEGDQPVELIPVPDAGSEFQAALQRLRVLVVVDAPRE